MGGVTTSSAIDLRKKKGKSKRLRIIGKESIKEIKKWKT